MSLSSPLDSGKRRFKARYHRREASAPYPPSKRVKRHETNNEKDAAFFHRETTPPRGGGFLARLASYIPIVNKLVTEEDEGNVEVEPVDEDCDDIQTTQEDLDLEEEEEEEKEVEKKVATASRPLSEPLAEKDEAFSEDKPVVDAPASPGTHGNSCNKAQVATPPRHSKKNTIKARTSRSPSCPSSTESADCSPMRMRSQRKRGDKRVFLPGPSHQAKRLDIAPSQRRNRHSTSPSPHTSALSVIKQKKTITLEEFERLQHQLHELVETTPPKAQDARTSPNGLERPWPRRFSTSFPGYVPGSLATRNHDALVVQDERNSEAGNVPRNLAPFGKRPRHAETRPTTLCFSDTKALHLPLTRQERMMRKPRPSRLLTGAKRDIATRSAYSAAVADKILAALKKVQTPLEQEAQKPTPSTSMAWAKYQLSIMDHQGPSVEKKVEKDHSDVPTPPPTTSIARVVFPQPSPKLPPPPAPQSVLDTPLKSTKTSSNDVMTPLFSPQTVSMTPGPAAKAPVSTQPQFQTIDGFKFTLPISEKRMKQVDEDTRLHFVFSPPPSLKEPPVKVVSTQKGAKGRSGAVPFDLMAASPKAKPTEWISKPPKVEEPEKPKEKPVAVEKVAKTTSEANEAAATTSTTAVVNPLARFMQLKPGQWKCPACSVLNEAKSLKCPCCETVKPGKKVVEKVTPAVSIAPDASSSNGFSFGNAVVDSKKDTNTSVNGSITSSGFCFGVPATDSKPKVDKKENGSSSANGFSFTASPAAATSSIKETTAGFTSGGFTFTTPTSMAETKPAGAGNTGGSSADSDVSASNAAISFGFSVPVKKMDDNVSKASDSSEKAAVSEPGKVPSCESLKAASFENTESAEPVKAASTDSEKAACASSFRLNNVATSKPAFEPKEHAATSSSSLVSSGFTFGSTTSTVAGFSPGKRKAPEPNSSTNESVSTFNVGTAATPSTAPPASSFSFTFGATPVSKQESPKDDASRPRKRVAGSFSATAEQAASKPPQIPAPESTTAPFSTSTFTFGASSSSSLAPEKPKDTTSAINAGGPSIVKPSDLPATKPLETMPATTGFTFGSSSTAGSTPIASFRQQTTESKPSGFSFGAATAPTTESTSAAPPSRPTFTFGSTSTTPATAFGATSSASTFGFGASPSTPAASTSPMTSAPASTPAFTFGSSATQPTGATAFGQPVAKNTSSFTFGSNSSSGFGSVSTSSGFGKTSPPPSSGMFGTSTGSAPTASTFQFGAPSPAASSAFGATPAASNGFGGSSGFGAAPGGFRSSSPAPAFGHQAFGNNQPPPTTTFGAPAFGTPATNAFGSAPPMSGFRTPSPTPAFGAPPIAAPSFGAAPTAGFGASTPGGAPSPGAFNVPSDGGFNMGAPPPQHARGRRILKAKSRTRRTS